MLKWQKQTARFTQGSLLISGRVPVGYAGYDGMTGRDDPNKYSWKLSLPGKNRSGKTVTEEEAQAACEAAFKEWLVASGLQAK